MTSTAHAAPHEPDFRFVGRRRELDALDAALRHCIEAEPRVVLLAGEPGIGKTSTAQEIARRATSLGVLALWGRCPEDPGAPPYWPWLQLIRRYIAQHDETALRDIVGPAAPQIAALERALTQASTEDVAQPLKADAAKARFQLFDAISGFWQRAAARQPLLLVLDDLHCADAPSLRLLGFVMAEAAGTRLMVLGTYRDSEVTRSNPLSDTLSELQRHGPVLRLLLGGFNPTETAEFVANATGTPSAALAALLHEQTEGHPLFLAELARDLRQAGALDTVVTRRGLLRVAHGVREVIASRLKRVSPACAQALACAAIIGREFSFDLLLRLLDDLPEETCRAALEEARAASLIHETAGPGAYQFSHALVRDSLSEEMPATEKAALHQRIATALEALHEGDLTPCLSALAHHYHAAGAAGDSARAIEFAIRAAKQATAMQAHEEAARHYLLASGALQPGTAADAQRCQLLLGLGRAQNSAGASTQALQSFAAAAACARQLDDASQLARAAIGFGDAQWRLGLEGSEAMVLIREALAHPAATDDGQRCALLGALCQAMLFANRPDEAEEAFREAVAIARRLDDPRVLFRALCSILPGRWFPDRLALRIEVAHEAIEVVRRAGHPEWVVPYLSGWHTGDLMESGDTVAATATARLHLTTSEATREPFNVAVALAALAMIATHEGRFAEAEPLAIEAMRCGNRFDPANAAGIFGVQMFTLRHHQGRLAELAPMLRQFLDRTSGGGAWRPGLAILHAELGDLDAARAIFDKLAIGGFAALASDAIRIASLAYLAEVCVRLDDRDRAAILFDLLLPYAGRNIVFGAHTASLGAADRLLGMLAMTLRRFEQAERFLEQAIA
ncbi:MAG: AAA family ATPase, partial [Burkholderiales bacterium]